MISRQGKYIGTITEGDLLWSIKSQNDLNLREAEHVPISSVRRKFRNEPVYVNATMEDLFEKALNQNFVPVVDDL